MTSTASPASPSTARPAAVEEGGIEAIPTNRRHGSPFQLFATWSAPNLEFATVFVGVIGVQFFGLDFWSALAAIVLGNALGSATHGILSTWGPREGLAQLVLSRTAFGLRGNIVPAVLNTAMAGLGWFAVNSVSGAFALTTLSGGALPVWLSLLIIVVAEVALAFVGHDLVQFFERYASILLGVIFLVAVITIFSTPGAAEPGAKNGFSLAGFTLTAAAAFGYAAGWNPYASDYTRYLPKDVSRAKVGWSAALGDFVSCTVLMAAGAASVSIPGAAKGASPTDAFVQSMPPFIAAITLVAIAIGAIAANALNIYSGAMSFLAAGVRIPFRLRRAIVALAFGVLGFLIALASILGNATAAYENFLLVIAYWIAPWLGVVLVDRYLRRGTAVAELVPDAARYRNPSGLIAFLVALVISIALFSNQQVYTGVVAKALPIGDLTPLVGFLVAGILYGVLFLALKPKLGGPVDEEPDVVIGVDAADSVA